MTILWKQWRYDRLRGIRTITNLDSDWRQTPYSGIVCVTVPDPDWGRVILNREEHYIKLPDETPFSTSDLGPTLASLGHFKQGIIVPQEVWQEVMQRAANDPDFPKGVSPRRRRTDKK